MQKLTKVVKTNLWFDEVSFKGGRKKYTFIKVKLQSKKNSDYYLFEKSLLPKDFDSLDENKKVDILMNIDRRECYKVGTQAYVNELHTYLNASDKLFKSFDNSSNFASINEITDESLQVAFKEGRIICISNYGWNHLIYVFGDFAPIVCTTILSYIGTPLANDCLPLDKKEAAMEHLNSLNFVKEVEDIEIPYYNRDENRSRSLKLKVSFSKEDRERLWKKTKNKSDDRERLFKDSIMMDGLAYKKDLLDFYGLRKFIRS